MQPQKYELFVSFRHCFYFFRTESLTCTCSENVTAAILCPAKEGMKPAAALRGPPTIVNEVFEEVGGASALSNHKSKG